MILTPLHLEKRLNDLIRLKQETMEKTSKLKKDAV